MADDSLFENVHIYSHTNGKPLWIGRSGDVAFTASFINCTFDKASSGSWYIGIFAHSNATVNFYGCTLFPNAANGTNWDWNGETGTLNLFATNGTDWGANATFIKLEDMNAAGGLNVGTATGAGTGVGKFSGTVDALSFTIGANVLTTTEWAFLDGQNQAVKTTSNAVFNTVRAAYKSSDNSAGITTSFTINDAVTGEHDLVFKNGILTSYTYTP